MDRYGLTVSPARSSTGADGREQRMIVVSAVTPPIAGYSRRSQAQKATALGVAVLIRMRRH